MTKQLMIESWDGSSSFWVNVDGAFIGSIHEVDPGTWIISQGDRNDVVMGSKYKAIVTLVGPQDAGELEGLLAGMRTEDDPQDA